MKILLGGIAGTGMNVLAQYLIEKKHEVYGFDRNFDRGERLHVKDFLEKKQVNIISEKADIRQLHFDQMIMTPAIEIDHPLLKECQKRHVPLKMRSCIIIDLFNAKKGIGIAGTSGKTSTTAMTAFLLKQKLDPDIFLGASILNWKNEHSPGNYCTGQGDHFILEIDESDKRLGEYYPKNLIVTNIDHDHHSVEVITEEFKKIMGHSESLIINMDCPRLCEIMKCFSDKNIITYSMKNSQADFFLMDVRQTENNVSFQINGQHFSMPVMGGFYAINALPACAVVVQHGVSLSTCNEILSQFRGVEARFEYQKCGSHHFVFDFAHNPSKIAMAVKSAKQFNVPVIYAFQPHGYTPLKECFDDMVEVFQKKFDVGDKAYIQKVYDVGGTADRRLNSDSLVAKINRPNIFFAPDRKWLETEIIKDLKHSKSKMVIISGARDDTLRSSLKFIAGHFN